MNKYITGFTLFVIGFGCGVVVVGLSASGEISAVKEQLILEQQKSFDSLIKSIQCEITLTSWLQKYSKLQDAYLNDLKLWAVDLERQQDWLKGYSEVNQKISYETTNTSADYLPIVLSDQDDPTSRTMANRVLLFRLTDDKDSAALTVYVSHSEQFGQSDCIYLVNTHKDPSVDDFMVRLKQERP